MQARIWVVSIVVLVLASGCDFLAPTSPPTKSAALTVPPIPIPPLPATNPHDYGHPMVCSGPFFATSDPGQYGVFQAPGTCEFLNNGVDGRTRLSPRPVIASMDDVVNYGPGRWPADTVQCSELLAVYIGIEGLVLDETELIRARARADACNVPVLVYYDSNVFDTVAFDAARPGDIMGVQAYPNIFQTPNLEQDIARTAASLDLAHIQGHRVALMRPLYTRSNQWPVEAIVAMQVPLTNLIAERPWVIIDGWFAWGRPSGIIDNPEFQQHARWLAEAAR